MGIITFTLQFFLLSNLNGLVRFPLIQVIKDNLLQQERSVS